MQDLMRQLILDTFRRAAGTKQLRGTVDALATEVSLLLGTQGPGSEVAKRREVMERLVRVGDFPLQAWWERSYWEPVVQMAIRDHVRPGDIAFDVGSNAGAFAVQMSRQAGPRGIICAFEASPRIIGRTQHNLVQAGANNVTLYHRAIWHRSGDFVHIEAGSHLNDRVAEGAGGVPVPTLALDDFIAATGLIPRFVKMDIEGAELDALQGCPRLLAEGRPVMALEQAPDDMRCHALLVAAGYVAVDLSTGKRIRQASDFSSPTGVVNVLFVPEEKAATNPYCDERQEVVMAIPGARFTRDAAGGASLADPPLLQPGRYVVRADFSASGKQNEVFAGLEADGEVVFRYHTHTAFLAECYREWVVQLDRPTKVAPFLRFLNGSDPTLDWRGVEVIRLPGFDGVAGPLVF
jgi:FkbM family methyltransferase